MNRKPVPLVVALLALGVAQADDHKGQGQNKSNHGQVVSECNHRANERNLKGHERKDYVEWCESRGGHHRYDDGRYHSEKHCYQKANDKGLSGDKRRNFLDKCFAGETGKKHKD